MNSKKIFFQDYFCRNKDKVPFLIAYPINFNDFALLLQLSGFRFTTISTFRGIEDIFENEYCSSSEKY